jgi:hypothetical protein
MGIDDYGSALVPWSFFLRVRPVRVNDYRSALVATRLLGFSTL